VPVVVGAVRRTVSVDNPAALHRFRRWARFTSVWAGRLTNLKSEAERTAQATGVVAGGLDIRRLGVGYLIKIDFHGRNPEQTVKIANAVLDAYILDQMNSQFQTYRRGSDWLQDRLQTLREQTAAAERAVVEFKQKNNIVSAGGRLMSDQELSDINSQLSSARTRVADIEARLGRIETILRADDPDLTDDATKVVALTSSLPGEGKSTLAVGMAQTAARAGRTILVDCDLRNPFLSRALAPEASVGLLHVLLGRCPLDEGVWTDPSNDLTFLPAVAIPDLQVASEILTGDLMRNLFLDLKRNYDHVVVDLSPLVALDVHATVDLIDAYVLVIEWGRTKIDVVQKALRNAKGVQKNVIGAVLNKVDMKQIKLYDKYHAAYQQYNDQYSARG